MELHSAKQYVAIFGEEIHYIIPKLIIDPISPQIPLKQNTQTTFLDGTSCNHLLIPVTQDENIALFIKVVFQATSSRETRKCIYTWLLISLLYFHETLAGASLHLSLAKPDNKLKAHADKMSLGLGGYLENNSRDPTKSCSKFPVGMQSFAALWTF